MLYLLNIIKLLYYILIKRNLYILRKYFFSRNFKINTFYSDHFLELKKNGYVIIKNFISTRDCELIIQDIEKFLIANKELTYHDNNYSDQRIHGAENISHKINSFYTNKLAIELGKYYYGGELENLMTMANKTIFVKDNKGSGGGWHRDGLNFQYKAILYLVQVNQNNGPFQLIAKSNSLLNISSISDISFIPLYIKLESPKSFKMIKQILSPSFFLSFIICSKKILYDKFIFLNLLGIKLNI
jgi:hypothetical protein